MRFLGLEIRRVEKQREKALEAVPRGWWPVIREPFTGAWQRNMEERRGDLLCYPTLYACITSIAQDIGILPFRLRKDNGEIWVDARDAQFDGVLARPNHYQTPEQFREQWQLSKMTQGNAYILKQRDAAGRVVRLYVLNPDPCKVMPMVTDSGEIYYRVSVDGLNGLPPGLSDDQLLIPASEIIHDREVTLHHPLVGVPPVCAANFPAVKNLRILRSASSFFGNHAQPGGILVAPGAISDETAERLKDYWNTNFTGANAGRVAVVGDGLKYESLAVNAADSQLVEQMRYSDEQICQAFRIPPFIVGIGTIPAGLKADEVALAYHNSALHPRINHMENLLDYGLGIPPPLHVELDTAPLMRMDPIRSADVETKLVAGKIKTPDEARRRFDLRPTSGGNTLWGQHQDYPLGVLAARNDLNPAPVEAGQEERALRRRLNTAKAVSSLWSALHGI